MEISSSTKKVFSPASLGRRTGYVLVSSCTSSGSSPELYTGVCAAHRASPSAAMPALTMIFRAETFLLSTNRKTGEIRRTPSRSVAGRFHFN